MRIRPTELGLKGLMLLAALEVAFLAASYSNLFFLLIAFCCVLGGLGLLWAIGNVRPVRVQIAAVPLAAADAPRTLQLVLQAGRGTRFDLDLEIVVQGIAVELGHVPLAAGTSTLSVQLRGLPRGVQRVQHLGVTSRFPFGFFRVRRDLLVDAEIVTHPGPARAPGGARQAMALAARFAATGSSTSSVAGLRPFRSGDSTSDVHWKASARRGAPIVKERELERGGGLEIVLDRRCSTARLEEALSIAASAVLAARESERPLRLLSQDSVLEWSRGRRDDQAMLRWLAAASTLPASAPNPPAGAAGCVHLPGGPPAEGDDA
ncbi:MAG TPA: DUF58 domain-containing protein [Planctomycetota bacterium]|nr:DUF58 domain-containing protein [Planctomycetota bacterium]